MKLIIFISPPCGRVALMARHVGSSDPHTADLTTCPEVCVSGFTAEDAEVRRDVPRANNRVAPPIYAEQSSPSVSAIRKIVGVAQPPAHPTLQLFLESVGSLVFTVDDLEEVPFDARTAPGVDRAEAYLTARLASGAVYYRDLIADGAATGVSRSTLYRAKRRLGLVATNGVWALPDAAVGSQQ